MEIKKNNWMYRLIVFSLEYSPNTSCGFIIAFIVSVLFFPVAGYAYLVFNLFETIDSNSKPIFPKKEVTHGKIGGVLFDMFWQTILLFIFFVISALIVGLIGYCTGSLKEWSQEYAMFSAAIITLIWPIGFVSMVKGYEKIKTKICKPIKYID